MDLTKYKPQKVTQYTFARKPVKRRNSTETLVSDVSNAVSEIADRNEELLEIIGTDETLEDELSEEDEELVKQAIANRKQRKLKRLMEMTKDDWKVTMLKLQKRRPPQTKTLLEMQSEHHQRAT
jgi:hypothetical protein